MKTRRKMKGGHHLYKRLGVSKYASQKQIRKSFKTLKKKRKANKKVKEAFKILSNKKTRKQYNNRYRKAVKRGGKRKTRRRRRKRRAEACELLTNKVLYSFFLFVLRDFTRTHKIMQC